MQFRKIIFLLIIIVIAVWAGCFLVTGKDNSNLQVQPAMAQVADDCWDDQRGHCYPRAGLFLWSTPPTEWAAKFDQMFSRPEDISYVKQVKNINPDQYYLFIQDWNCATEMSLTEDQKAHRTNGDLITDYCSGGAANMSTLYPSGNPGNSCGPSMLCYEYADYLMSEVNNFVGDFDWVDGFGTDGFYNGDLVFPYLIDENDVDFDRDHVNDFNQYGQTVLEQSWQRGADAHVEKLRSRLDAYSQKLLMINTGGWHGHDWKAQANGMLLENCTEKQDGWAYDKQMYQAWMDEAREPTFVDFDCMIGRKDDFQGARFILGKTLYGTGYVSISDQKFNWHYYNHEYDEYQINLGWPTRAMEYVPGKPQGDNGRGVYARFFDNGVVILNVNANNIEVSDGDLRNMSGYNGPYYRFEGGQDHARNNGQPFSLVNLLGRDNGDGTETGDAVILTKQPTRMVTDIYVDSDDESTSAGSQKAQYSGSWKHDSECFEIANYWSQDCKLYDPNGPYIYGLSYASPGNNTARFEPNIKTAGDYEVFEWHGEINSMTEASSVQHTIYYANYGSRTLAVNQQQNSGRWNSLGTYYFNPADPHYVLISAQGADGVVVADAVKFVYKGNYGNIKTKGAARPNIKLTKFSSKNQAASGQDIIYTIDYENTGSETAKNIEIVDYIPQGTTYINGSASGIGQYNAIDNSVRWNFSLVNHGETGSLSFGVRVN